VAEYSDPDSPDDSGDRVRPADSRGAHATPQKRGLGSSLRQRGDREHFRRSDRDGAHEGDRLSRLHLFRSDIAFNGSHGQAKRGAACRDP
jgi:hypothetical protein